MSEEEKVAAAPEVAPAATTVKEKAPGAMMALVFGIIAWVTCWGPIGIIFGFLALGKAGKAKKAFAANPEKYNSPKVFTIIGKIGGWLGIVFGIIDTIWLVMMMMG
ncbi:MAG: hypothetical protein ACI9J3_001220 [Parvicellaceae bacterium]|jgi:hypothetical protein